MYSIPKPHHTRKRIKFPWEIGIPGSNVEQLRTHTLQVLHSYMIPAEHITIFVTTKQEEKVFRRGLPKGWYGRIVVCGLEGPDRLTWIHSYYPVDAAIVILEPTISKFLQTEPNSNQHRPLTNLVYVFRLGFYHCLAKGIRLWGISPHPKRVKEAMTTDLRLCPKSCWGCFNSGDFNVTIADGEDYERTIRAYTLDHGVIRLNTISAITSSTQPADTVFVQLRQEYPEYVILYTNSTGQKRVRLRELMKQTPQDMKQG
jgi:hypothetical protein